MKLPRTSIYLRVGDTGQSRAFYEALLGAPPTRSSVSTVVFETAAPALVLTLETRPRAGFRKTTTLHPSRTPDVARPVSTHNRFVLVVTEPQQVGQAAIALRRAGVRLRLQDQGLEVRDPDGNEWRVRFVPFTDARAVVEIPVESADERN